MNHWWEINVQAAPFLEELLFWRLQQFGCQGMSSQDQGQKRLIQAYLPQNQAQPLDLAALAIRLRQDALSQDLAEPTVQWHLIHEEDWAASWKDHWQPQEVGERLLINPAWMSLPDKCDRLILQLNPGVAFGTGAHPTTQLCLEALEMQLDETFEPIGDVVIADIGCGTGILAIAALLLGAYQTYAVDTDPLAVEAATVSRKLNGIDPMAMIVAEGSVETLVPLLKQPVDGLVCNILADVIVDIAPQLSQITRPGSWGIFSGLLVDQAETVVEALEKLGWTMTALWRRQSWCCLHVYRN